MDQNLSGIIVMPIESKYNNYYNQNTAFCKVAFSTKKTISLV